MNAEFQDWHSHDHFRERLGISGFSRATCWSGADGGEVVLLANYEKPEDLIGQDGILK